MRSAPPSTGAPQPPSDLEEETIEFDTGILVPPPPSVRMSQWDLMGLDGIHAVRDSQAQVNKDPRYQACKETWEARGIKYDGFVTINVLMGVDGLQNVSIVKNEHEEFVGTNGEIKRWGPVPAEIISCLSAAIWAANWPASTDYPLTFGDSWKVTSSEKPNSEYYVE